MVYTETIIHLSAGESGGYLPRRFDPPLFTFLDNPKTSQPQAWARSPGLDYLLLFPKISPRSESGGNRAYSLQHRHNIPILSIFVLFYV